MDPPYRRDRACQRCHSCFPFPLREVRVITTIEEFNQQISVRLSYVDAVSKLRGFKSIIISLN